VRHALALPGHVAMCLGKRQVNISTFVSRFCFFVKRDCIEHRDLAFILGKSALCCSLGEPRFSRDPAVDLKGWVHVLDAAPNASTSPARRPHSLTHESLHHTAQHSTQADVYSCHAIRVSPCVCVYVCFVGGLLRVCLCVWLRARGRDLTLKQPCYRAFTLQRNMRSKIL